MSENTLSSNSYSEQLDTDSTSQISDWDPAFFVPRDSDFYGYQYYFPAANEAELYALKAEPELFKEIMLEILDPEKWLKRDLRDYRTDRVLELTQLNYKHEFREPNKLRLFTDNVIRFSEGEGPEDRQVESIDLEKDRFTGAVFLRGITYTGKYFVGKRVHTELVVSIDGQMPNCETFDNYELRTFIGTRSIH